mmetsp:Transcript_14527/g.11669  ORF Transcript_14527/g.11669 Transcript_14527/m.11669 type:complete len:94 (-) Transcript_14527:175-456(-)
MRHWFLCGPSPSWWCRRRLPHYCRDALDIALQRGVFSTAADGVVKHVSIDKYVQSSKDKDCCTPPPIGDKIKTDAEAINHRVNDVQDMPKCKR